MTPKELKAISKARFENMIKPLIVRMLSNGCTIDEVQKSFRTSLKDIQEDLYQ
jgi:hypothetical protein